MKNSYKKLKMLGIFLLSILLLYVTSWILVYLDCRCWNLWHEPCIWNLREHWFPYPVCVCVR